MRVSSVALAALVGSLFIGATAEANSPRRGHHRHGNYSWGYNIRLGPPVYAPPVVVYRPRYYTQPVYTARYYSAPAPAPRYYAPPHQVHAAPAPVATFGLGLRASALSVGRDAPGAGGIGIVARLRGGAVEGEIELGQDRFEHEARVDTRIGAALIIPVTKTQVVPYLVVGAGVNNVHLDGVSGDRTQGYLSAGAGLGFHVSSTFDLTADVRGYARKFVDARDEADISAYFPIYGDDRENAIEGRVTGVLYF